MDKKWSTMQMKYQVYLELYGKKLRVTVDAVSANDAIKQVRAAVIIHKVSKIESEVKVDEDSTIEMLKNLFNMK
jgi:hypothetical protein